MRAQQLEQKKKKKQDSWTTIDNNDSGWNKTHWVLVEAFPYKGGACIDKGVLANDLMRPTQGSRRFL